MKDGILSDNCFTLEVEKADHMTAMELLHREMVLKQYE